MALTQNVGLVALIFMSFMWGFVFGRSRGAKCAAEAAPGTASAPHYVGFGEVRIPAVRADYVLDQMAKTIGDDAIAADLSALAGRVRSAFPPARDARREEP